MSRIALYGLSANPPSGLGGHEGIVQYLVDSVKFDEIWILPVYQHIFSSKRKLAEFNHRIEMCKLCFEDHSSSTTTVRVMSLEKEVCEHYLEVNGPYYRVGTVDILRFLLDRQRTKQGQSDHISLILGSDTFIDLACGKWKEADIIMELASAVLVIARVGMELHMEDNKVVDLYVKRYLSKIQCHQPTGLTNISSTDIRSRKLWLIKDFHDPVLINPLVLDYIISNKVYDYLLE